MLVVFLFPALFSWQFISSSIDKTEYLAGPLTVQKKVLACVSLTVLVGLTAGLGIFPAWYATRLFEARSALPGVIEGLLFCFLTMAGSLAPAVGYYLPTKNKESQIKSPLVGVLVFLGVLTMTAPSIFSVASVGSTNLLGVSDRKLRNYLVSNEEYPAISLDQSSWKINNHGAEKYTLEAFSLYGFGPVILLCPAAMQGVKNEHLDRQTEQCIAFKSSAVLPLDGIGAEVSSDSSG